MITVLLAILGFAMATIVVLAFFLDGLRSQHNILAGESVALRRQRDTAYELLKQSENYTTKLENEQLLVRAIAGAKGNEKTSDAVRRVVEIKEKREKEVWP